MTYAVTSREETEGTADRAGRRPNSGGVCEPARRVRGGTARVYCGGAAEFVERSFAHCYERARCGAAVSRTGERLKRQLIHVGAFDLSLILRNCWARARRGSGRTAWAGLF